jgi:hypothetical protein
MEGDEGAGDDGAQRRSAMKEPDEEASATQERDRAAALIWHLQALLYA